MSKPKPVPKELVCSECGLDWEGHPKNATKSDCIDLLRKELNRHSAIRTSWCWCTHSCNCACSCHVKTQWTWTPYNWQSTGSFTFSDTSNTIAIN